MTLEEYTEELVKAVKDMRESQTAYFKAKSEHKVAEYSFLDKARAAESKVDKIVKNYGIHLQQTIF